MAGTPCAQTTRLKPRIADIITQNDRLVFFPTNASTQIPIVNKAAHPRFRARTLPTPARQEVHKPLGHVHGDPKSKKLLSA